jgi:purine-binding chemotaxis protein CheW
METASESAEQTQYLTFFLGGDEYAIGILRVREIIEYDVVTHVPATPPWIRGVINLRGAVVPVVDLSVKFGLPETPVSRRTCIVIVEVELEGQQTAMGVIADLVSQVIDLRPEDVEPPPPFGTRVRVDFLKGMGKLGKRFALVLDIDRVLSASELLLATSLDVPADEAVEGESTDATAAESPEPPGAAESGP